MTPLQELIGTIRSWLAIDPEIYPDDIVTNWIRMSEEYLSETLRSRYMVQIDWMKLVEGRVELPKDWLELDTVRFYPQGKPLIWAPRDEFYTPQYDICNRYTIVGNYIILGKIDTVTGVDIEISYYQRIPPIGDETTWLYQYNPRLFTLAVLWHAAAYAVEDQRVAGWQQAVESMVDTINTSSQRSRHSGSILVANKNRRSFG